MNKLVKSLVCTSVVGALSWIGIANAGDDETRIETQVIEIKAHQDHEVKVKVDNNGDAHALTFTMDELRDPVLIEDKLLDLDPQTRETVLKALEGLTQMADGDFDPGVFVTDEDQKVVIMHKGEGQLMQVHADSDMDYEFEVENADGSKVVRKHVIVGNHDGVLTGHTGAIVRLIEKGEFSQDELDEIQAAVDAKR